MSSKMVNLAMNFKTDAMLLRAIFDAFCAAVHKALPANNTFDITPSQAAAGSMNMDVVGFPCRVRFDLHVPSSDNEATHGVLVIERVLSKDKTAHLLTLYFDGLGNGADTVDADTWPYELSKPGTSGWFAILVLDALRKSFQPETAPPLAMANAA